MILLPHTRIATGRTAEIYPWQDGQILKLFFDWFSLDAIWYEQRINRAVHASGLPVPAVGELVQMGGRSGLIYERVDGANMYEVVSRRPWLLPRLARRAAELHAEMHASTARADIPAQRGRLVSRINQIQSLPDELRTRLLAELERLPDGTSLCHGDFHPGNILVTPSREVVIDWIDASYGSPLADVARTVILMRGAAETSQTRTAFEKTALRAFLRIYLRRYFQLRPGGEDEMRRWLPVMSAARLWEDIPELEGWLLEEAKKINLTQSRKGRKV